MELPFATSHLSRIGVKVNGKFFNVRPKRLRVAIREALIRITSFYMGDIPERTWIETSTNKNLWRSIRVLR
ncbi:hypothetical protein Psta_3442 [Pirellula staleyi DSM 6068]|uniref:Uncharacterized protein n=1 Tax=Pirellula staleyi (strain ATCC 27377 / DSM 6068 / ICPB 4128) TaxID=530564 RepID=D2QY28_PIRSD|nr:hypothetical protein Psta_3442 [Pirellula staleyi DSM 6068]